MTKLLCTIWALILNTLGISIFRTCFANAMEDEEGDALITGPPISSFFFASAVYTIILNSSIFPSNFRKPKPYLLCPYEFLATAFFLEFSIACIWTPIDVLILTTLPKNLCNMLIWLDQREAAQMVLANKMPMAFLSCLLTFGFLILSLHVTKALDLTLLPECGWSYFCDYVTERMWKRLSAELPRMSRNVRSRGRKKKRSRARRRSSS